MSKFLIRYIKHLRGTNSDYSLNLANILASIKEVRQAAVVNIFQLIYLYLLIY